jgi:hypothetical protein
VPFRFLFASLGAAPRSRSYRWRILSFDTLTLCIWVYGACLPNASNKLANICTRNTCHVNLGSALRALAPPRLSSAPCSVLRFQYSNRGFKQTEARCGVHTHLLAGQNPNKHAWISGMRAAGVGEVGGTGVRRAASRRVAGGCPGRRRASERGCPEECSALAVQPPGRGAHRDWLPR